MHNFASKQFSGFQGLLIGFDRNNAREAKFQVTFSIVGRSKNNHSHRLILTTINVLGREDNESLICSRVGRATIITQKRPILSSTFYYR